MRDRIVILFIILYIVLCYLLLYDYEYVIINTSVYKVIRGGSLDLYLSQIASASLKLQNTKVKFTCINLI